MPGFGMSAVSEKKKIKAQMANGKRRLPGAREFRSLRSGQARPPEAKSPLNTGISIRRADAASPVFTFAL